MSRFALLLALACMIQKADAFEGVKSTWMGYDKTVFKVGRRACFVVEPKTAATGKPWLWRTRFPLYHAEIDQLLLADGYHIAYINTDGMLGSPRALKHWEAFYQQLTSEHGLSTRAALYGVSRGGLFVYRWAKQHPETVACIYNDTPVCDFKSWPGGRGSGIGSAADWKACLREYGFDETAALAYKDNPIDNLEPIARAQIPIMHIVTEDDQVVPPTENTYLVRQRLESLGHRLFYVVSLAHGPRSNGHHFDLEHPEIGYYFVKKYTEFGELHPVYLRSGLANCRHVFTKRRRGRVAFLGGSITQMEGWRNLVAESLQRRFPSTEFDFVFAGISSTDSTMGAFRLQQDVFARGPVDLLFIESAVNELHNGRRNEEIQPAVEGIILQARRQNPFIDIVAQYFFDERYVEENRAGRTPWQIAALERVALQYGVNAIDQTRRVTQLFDTGKMTPREFGGVHPAPPGHRVYAEMIDHLLDKAWSSAIITPQPHNTPWQLTRNVFDRGHFVPLTEAQIRRGWQLESNWQPPHGGATRSGFVGVPFLSATEPGAEFTLDFTGTAIGLVVVAGPDAGVIEYSVDGGETKSLDQMTAWSERLNIPWIYLLENDLRDEPHRLMLRTSEKKNPRSKGHACHICYLAVNGANVSKD